MNKFVFASMMMLSTMVYAQVKTYSVTLTKNNVIVMNDAFEGDSVARVTQAARELDSKLPSNEPIYLVLDTPGGSIFAGMELIANLNNLNRPVHTISIFAASMGFQTVQGLNGNRYMVPNGTLMSHKARGGVSGEFPGQLDSRYAHILSVIQKLDKRAADRSKGKHTLTSYESLIENEYWCIPEECAKQGFIDGAVNVKCDNTLSGTTNKVVAKGMFMGMVLELVGKFSDCPTTTSALDYDVRVSGTNLFSSLKTAKTSSDVATAAPYLTDEQAKVISEFINKNITEITRTSRDRKVEYYRK